MFIEEIYHQKPSTPKAGINKMKVYHGTSSRYLCRLLEEGLIPKSSLLDPVPSTHLSETFNQAKRYALEKTGKTSRIKHPYQVVKGAPIVIELDIPENLITDYIGTRLGKNYWTIHDIPPKYITKVHRLK